MTLNQFKTWLATPGFLVNRIANTFGAGAKNGTGVAVTEYGDGVLHHTHFVFTNYDLVTTDAGASGASGGAKIYDMPEGLWLPIGASSNLTVVGSGGVGASAAVVHSLGTVVAGADDTLTGTEANIISSTAGTLSSSAGTFKGKTRPTIGTQLGLVSLTDNSAGVANDTITAMADPADSPASQDALRDDLVANFLANCRNNIADLAAKVNAILAGAGFRLPIDGTGTPVDIFLNAAMPDAGHSASAGNLRYNGTAELIWINAGDN